MTDAPLYETDPAAWRDHLAEGNRTQARKRVSVDGLILDQQGRILLVNPRYKPGWDMPGGMAEANEPPLDTLRRELSEELGLGVGPRPCLLIIDWVPPHDPWDDLLNMIFHTRTLQPGQISAIRLQDGELDEYRFFTPAQADELLQPRTARRLKSALHALKLGQVLYLQDGYPATGNARPEG